MDGVRSDRSPADVPADEMAAASGPGGPFPDPAADGALIRELKAAVRPEVEVVGSATGSSDPAFATAMAERLDAHDRAWAATAVNEQGGMRELSSAVATGS